MTDKKKNTDKAEKAENKQAGSPHDALIKKVMENPIAAAEFLDEHLPAEFKEKLDLSTVKVEKESFVEANLTRQLSDIVLSVRTKDNEEAFIYTLLENQSTPDYWISFRLWKYVLLLAERHMKGKDKLPLICPIVLYNGSRKYNAPRNLWQLFTDPAMARKMLADNYHLIDLQAMSDDDINYDRHISMFTYMLKHADERDKIKLIGNMLEKCVKAIQIDKEHDYLYITLAIWYNDNKIEESQREDLDKLIEQKLPTEDKENIMRTIADAYRDEGRNEGRNEGMARGFQEGVEKTALKMLQQKLDLKLISSVTGLSSNDLLKLKNRKLAS
jgi:predicted transposase/invertase (TIGR01784 family)